jgi:hypothetical protein
MNILCFFVAYSVALRLALGARVKPQAATAENDEFSSYCSEHGGEIIANFCQCLGHDNVCQKGSVYGCGVNNKELKRFHIQEWKDGGSPNVFQIHVLQGRSHSTNLVAVCYVNARNHHFIASMGASIVPSTSALASQSGSIPLSARLANASLNRPQSFGKRVAATLEQCASRKRQILMYKIQFPSAN